MTLTENDIHRRIKFVRALLATLNLDCPQYSDNNLAEAVVTTAPSRASEWFSDAHMIATFTWLNENGQPG